MNVQEIDLLLPQVAIDEIEEEKKEEPHRDIQTSKPRFPRCSRRMSTHYSYIPTAPRNLPYMRRAY